jgi:predicted phage-related endonuclease
MSQQSDVEPQGGPTLDALVIAERALDERLAQARREADLRVQQAAAAAQERIVRRRQQIVAQVAQALESRKRQFDDQLGGEARQQEYHVAQLIAALEPLQKSLSARILTEVLGL